MSSFSSTAAASMQHVVMCRFSVYRYRMTMAMELPPTYCHRSFISATPETPAGPPSLSLHHYLSKLNNRRSWVGASTFEFRSTMPSPSRHYPFLGIGMLYLCAILSVVLRTLLLHDVDAYSIGDVDPRALRGIWRLTSLDDEGLPFERNKKYGRGIFHTQSAPPSDPRTIWQLRGFLPMKEFTTYPKKKQGELDNQRKDLVPPKKQTEIFIKLKDDHTFEQCKSLFSDGKDAR